MEDPSGVGSAGEEKASASLLLQLLTGGSGEDAKVAQAARAAGGASDSDGGRGVGSDGGKDVASAVSEAMRIVGVPSMATNGDTPLLSTATSVDPLLTMAATDNPLSDSVDSSWREWHSDEELRTEIAKDADRTLPDYAFFTREQPRGRLHHAALSRVLFV